MHEALVGVTHMRAHGSFGAKGKGTLEKGKHAYLVALERNPLNIPVVPTDSEDTRGTSGPGRRHRRLGWLDRFPEVGDARLVLQYGVARVVG